MKNSLHPKIKPYKEGYLQVSEIHNLWYAEYGNPHGMPVISLHGGPGGGSCDDDARFFDPKFYRIILFDQRGAGKSKPFCELRENNTKQLISDIEKLRLHLNIEKWVVKGGSWGSALALLYGISYPKNIIGFILRGQYTATKAESENLWYGMRDNFPEIWQEFRDFLPENERTNLKTSYIERILSNDANISFEAAYSFVKYDTICAFSSISEHDLEIALNSKHEIISLAKIFSHFESNSYFIEENYIMKNLHIITHIPCLIIHGRYDNICRTKIAYQIHKNWPDSELNIVEMAGHTEREEKIAEALTFSASKMQDFTNKLSKLN